MKIATTTHRTIDLTTTDIKKAVAEYVSDGNYIIKSSDVSLSTDEEQRITASVHIVIEQPNA